MFEGSFVYDGIISGELDDDNNGILIGNLGVDTLRGKSLEYMWDGTKLGVKREDQTEFQFVELNKVPVKGVDYFTETDKKEISDEVKLSLADLIPTEISNKEIEEIINQMGGI